MMKKQELEDFWQSQVQPRFDQDALGYTVETEGSDTRDASATAGSRLRYVNLDNAATTTPFKSVVANLEQELKEYGSVHRGAGEKSKVSTERYEESRETVRRFVNGKPGDYVVYAKNTTEAMNQLAYFFSNIRGKVLVSDIEHSSSHLPWMFAEGRHAVNSQVSLEDALAGNDAGINQAVMDKGREKVLTYRTKDDFTFDLDDIEKTLKAQSEKGPDERIKAFVVTGASNVTGYKPKLKELAALAHKYGAMIILDGCQLLQHEQVDMQETGIDFVAMSGHKMYAPFGAGAIVGDKRILDTFWPYQMGGGNFTYISKDGEVIRQKDNGAHDPGTPNFAGARALHHSINELQAIGLDRIAAYEHSLVEYAFSELEKIPGVKLYIGRNADGSFDRSLITFSIDGVHHKKVAETLNGKYGIGVRSGAYCVYEFSRRINGTTSEADRRITEDARKGITKDIPGSVRASFSLYNNVDDAERLVSAVRKIAAGAYKR